VRETSIRHKLVLWFVLLIAGFLVGFIPQYAKTAAVAEGTIGLDKAVGILSEQRTILAAL
jgi:hypothetical protein